MDEAAVILFLVDVRSGITPLDYEIAEMLHRSEKPVILAANKGEAVEAATEAVVFYELGLGEPKAVSAAHGLGTGDLLDAVITLLPAGNTS